MGKLISKNVGGSDITTFSGLQQVDYSYNIRGWLKLINDVNNLNGISGPTDLFAFKINYNEVDNDINHQIKKLYNGNISETYWRTASDNILRKYGYQYDDLNRLRGSFYQKPQAPVALTNSYNESMDYDKNGNILNMFRTGGLDNQIETIAIDDLKYFYSANSNQLSKVIDATNEPQGFKDDTTTDPGDTNDDYKYDANGNMIADENKGIVNIAYNHLNRTTHIDFGVNGIITYLYDATGKKVKKTVVTGENETITHYLDGFQYKGDELQFFPTSEGYVNISHVKYINGIFQQESETIDNQYSYVYNYLDHLGNIRLSYGKDPSNGALRIIEENHYYPFGLKHTNYNSDKMMYVKEDAILKIKLSPNNITTSYNYKYQGQERQDELGLNWDSFKWRNYDYAIGRFLGIDKLAEDYNFQSPYSFSSNRVIDNVEIEGLEGEDFRFSQAQKAKGGVQKAAEEYSEKVNQEAFETVMRIATPIEDIYGFVTGKDFDGKDYNRGQALEMILLTAVPEVKAEVKAGVMAAEKEIVKLEKTASTSREARREAMRDAGIPTSQPLHQDKATKSADKVFLTRDSKNTVQNATNDVSHKGQPHWEAGPTKKNPNTADGLNRSGNNNKPQMAKPKSKVNY